MSRLFRPAAAALAALALAAAPTLSLAADTLRAGILSVTQPDGVRVCGVAFVASAPGGLLLAGNFGVKANGKGEVVGFAAAKLADTTGGKVTYLPMLKNVVWADGAGDNRAEQLADDGGGSDGYRDTHFRMGPMTRRIAAGAGADGRFALLYLGNDGSWQRIEADITAVPDDPDGDVVSHTAAGNPAAFKACVANLGVSL